MFEFITALVLAALGAVVLGLWQSRLPARERGLIWACYGANVFCVGAIIWITANLLGGGDMFGYRRMGRPIAELLRQDFPRYFPDVVRLLLQQSHDLPMYLEIIGGGSTHSMIALSGLLHFATFDSFAAATMVVSVLACSGQLAMYFGLRDFFAPHLHRKVQIAILLVPSVLFWSSGLIKEAVAMIGLGWITFAALKWIRAETRWWHLVLALLGLPFVVLSKAYLLIPFTAATGIAFYWSRANRPGSSLTTRPLYFFIGVGLAVAGMVVIGELFPRFALTNIAEEAAELQQVGQRVTGDSSYMMGDPTERTLLGQLAFAPLALFTALFRPLIVEIHNVQALVNAVETTVLLGLFVRILYHHGIRRSTKLLFSSPALVFCLVFVLICAVGVGLTTTNLGTLSRYRMPLVPFFVCLLLMLNPPFHFSTSGR